SGKLACENTGCATVTPVIASVFFFVRWFVGRFGCAVGQTHSLPSFGLSLGWCDLANRLWFTNTIKNKQTVSNCVTVKRWHIHSTILFLSFQVYNYQVLIMQQLIKA